MDRSRRGTGFTLVELLVVIGIIAILIAILLPALNRVRQQAQVTKCAALVRQIAAATVMYANENKGALPPLRAHSGDTFAFTNAGYLQNQDWNNTSQVGSNIGRLVAAGYLGPKLPANWSSGNAPDTPYYTCPSAPDPTMDPSLNNRVKYFYNFHMKATTGGDLYRAWPKIAKYGKPPVNATKLWNLSTNFIANGQYPNIPRAIVADPVYGHTTGGKAYVTHPMGSMMAFNLGYTDGSVQTVKIKSTTVLPNSGEYKQIIAIIQFLETVASGNAASGSYTFSSNEYAMIPFVP